MSYLVTAAQLKEFSDWLKTDSAHYLIGRFGRGNEHELITDHDGPLRFYDPYWEQTGAISPLRLIPGDFLGILTANDSSQVVVSLAAGNPVSIAAQFLGGALDGLSVQSKTVNRIQGFNGVDIWMYFVDGSHQYAMQIVKSHKKKISWLPADLTRLASDPAIAD